MQSAPQSEKEPNRTEFASNAVLIRQQLNRLLAHPLFTNSKRYPVLLAYTVEQALLGNASELKERTIGVEAFGRRPDYDVNLDPVVRTTAAEVRKRLSQYYYNAAHAGGTGHRTARWFVYSLVSRIPPSSERSNRYSLG